MYHVETTAGNQIVSLLLTLSDYKIYIIEHTRTPMSVYTDTIFIYILNIVPIVPFNKMSP